MDSFKKWLLVEYTHHVLPAVLFGDRRKVDGLDMRFEDYINLEDPSNSQLLKSLVGPGARWSGALPPGSKDAESGQEMLYVNFDSSTHSTRLSLRPEFPLLEDRPETRDWLLHAKTYLGNDEVTARHSVSGAA